MKHVYSCVLPGTISWSRTAMLKSTASETKALQSLAVHHPHAVDSMEQRQSAGMHSCNAQVGATWPRVKPWIIRANLTCLTTIAGARLANCLYAAGIDSAKLSKQALINLDTLAALAAELELPNVETGRQVESKKNNVATFSLTIELVASYQTALFDLMVEEEESQASIQHLTRLREDWKRHLSGLEADMLYLKRWQWSVHICLALLVSVDWSRTPKAQMDNSTDLQRAHGATFGIYVGSECPGTGTKVRRVHGEIGWFTST